jgi:glutaredoxin-dependent peroxiredoxin
MSLVGSLAPDFTLRGHHGEDVTLSHLRGQNVVLAFYPGAFTGVCEKELCTFRDAMGTMNAMNATVLGISVDSPFANGGFALKNELNFHLFSDHDRRAIHAYGVAFENFAGMDGYTVSQRAVFIVAADGTVAFEWIAPNPGVEPDYEQVQAELAKL